jgi:nitrogen regulatory protein P-II 1
MISQTSSARRSRNPDPASRPIRKVVAIIRHEVLEKVEERMQSLQVPGITVSKVKGYGQYANFYRHDWMLEHARIEIILRRERVREVVQGIIDAASSGLPGDGLVFVVPVDTVYRIRSGTTATADELGGGGQTRARPAADRAQERRGRRSDSR